MRMILAFLRGRWLSISLISGFVWIVTLRLYYWIKPSLPALIRLSIRRWWALRKHLRRAPDGSHVFSEFINRAEPVSSALGHHLMEGRWLHDPRYHDEYVRWWLAGNDGKPHA